VPGNQGEPCGILCRQSKQPVPTGRRKSENGCQRVSEGRWRADGATEGKWLSWQPASRRTSPPGWVCQRKRVL